MGWRAPTQWIAGALGLLACASGPTTTPDDVAAGLHRETWYGWSLLLPERCDAREEERFEGEAIGRVKWRCDGLTVMLDATPFADPQHHTAPIRLQADAPLCAEAPAGMQRVTPSDDAPRPPERVTFWELILGSAFATHRREADRQASLLVFGTPTACERMERVLRSLRPHGPPLAVPPDELRATRFALPIARAGCHRHYAPSSCMPGVPADEVLHCGDRRVTWRELGSHALDTLRQARPNPPTTYAGPLPYARSDVSDNASRWQVLLPWGELGVTAPPDQEHAVLELLARVRMDRQGAP